MAVELMQHCTIAYRIITISWLHGSCLHHETKMSEKTTVKVVTSSSAYDVNFFDASVRPHLSRSGICASRRPHKSLMYDEPLDRLGMHGSQRSKMLSSFFCVNIQCLAACWQHGPFRPLFMRGMAQSF